MISTRAAILVADTQPMSRAGITRVSLITRTSPGAQQVRQVADGAVLERRSRTHDEQAGGIPRLGGPERDPVVRQVEIEKVDAHWVHRGGRGLSRGSGQPSMDPPSAGAAMSRAVPSSLEGRPIPTLRASRCYTPATRENRPQGADGTPEGP